MLTTRTKTVEQQSLFRRMDCRIKSGNDGVEKELLMTERALAFVEEWVSEHVEAKDADGDIGARAKALASECLAAASKAGIPAAEIGEAIDDLPEFMVGAIEEAEERDEHAHQFESDEEAAELIDAQSVEDAEEDALEDEEDEEKR